jgi:hypothetical protein
LVVPTSDGPKHARIVEHPPSSGSTRYWYVLEVVAGPHPPGTHLRNAFARRQANPLGLATEVDSNERQAAIAKLTAWARTNGWTVVNE